MVPESWIKSFLQQRELEWPDKRQLFAYRVSDTEFQKLADCLKLIFAFDTNKVFRVKRLDACLVIYAAEWWRREYNGQFRYRDVLGSVGMDEDRLTPQQRASLIRTGLSFWKREVRKRNNKNFYLATLAVEGGIPLAQLAHQGGALESLMVRVLKKHMTRNIELAALVESNIDYVPQFMRGEEAREVIVSILDTVASLSRHYKLSKAIEPLEELNEKCPDWRERFPFPIGDQHSRILLEKLIGVTKERIEQSFPFQLTRSLHFNGSDIEVNLTASLDIEPKIKISELEITKDKKQALEALPRVQVIFVNSRGNEEFVKNAIIGVRNGEKFIDFRFSAKPWRDDDAMDEWWISLRDKGQEIARIDIHGGGSISDDLPWVFRKSEGEANAIFLGEGSQSVRDTDVFVYLPKSFELEKADAGSLTGISSFLEGDIYSLNGSLKGRLNDDIFSVKTGVNSSAKQFAFKGRNLSYKTNPSATFVGELYLSAISADEQKVFERLDQVRVEYRAIGPNCEWLESPIGCGVYHVRAVDSDGITLLRRKLGILPSDFSVALNAGSVGPSGGDYVFKGNGFGEQGQVQVSTTSACDLTTIEDQDRLCISIIKRGDVPPAYCDLTLFSAATNTDIQFRLAFPAIGAMLVDRAGKKIRNRSSINLSRLSNYHLMLYRGQEIGQSASIAIALKQGGVRRFSKDLSISITNNVETIALNDFQDEIRALAALGDTIDGEISVNVMMQGRDMLAFTINLFDIRLTLDKEKQKVYLKDDYNILGSEEIQAIELKAISIHEPQSGLVRLGKKMVMVEDVIVAEFDFSDIGQGAWIIFQSEESNLKVRPTLWVVNELVERERIEKHEQVDFNSLNAIQKIEYPEARASAIKEFFPTLADDFDHESWEYITTLYAQMKHLPLRAVDIWPLISKDEAMLAAIYARGHIDISEKLGAEFSICWELVSLNSWITALEKSESFMDHHMDEQLRHELLLQTLASIAELSPSLSGVVKIVSSKLNIENGAQAELTAFQGERGFEILGVLHDEDYSEGMFYGFSKTKEDELYSWVVQQIEGVDPNLVNLLVPPEYLRADTKNYGVYTAALLPLAFARFAIKGKALGNVPTRILFDINQLMSRQANYVSAMYSPLLCYLYLNEGNA